MKGLPLSLSICLRFSRGRQRSGLVSMISVISTIGISLGVIVLIISLSAMNGFERELKDRILSVVPHAEIEPVEQPFIDWKVNLDTFLQSSEVAGIAPYISFTGLMESGVKLAALQLRGVDPVLEQKISSLDKYVRGIAWSEFKAGEQQVILGKGIAEQLNVTVDDWVTVMIPNHNEQGSMNLAQPKRVRLHIVGTLDMVGELGNSFGLIPLNDAQNYLVFGEGISGLAFKFNDAFSADTLIQQEGKKYYQGPDAWPRSWMSNYGHVYRDIQLVRTIMYIAMVLVIGVACFNIVSTLVMAVKDKSGDIAVLRTQGAKDNLIRSIFIWYGLMTGLIGSLAGAVIGVILSLNLTAVIQFIEKLVNHQFLPADVYFIDFLPTELHWRDVTIVLTTALILSLVASWYPAQRACRLNPARILSGL